MGGGDQANFRVGWGRLWTRPVAGAASRRGRRALVLGVLGVVALASASCSSGPQHEAAKVSSHASVDRVKTDPATSTSAPQATTTTTTAPAVKTAPNTFVPPAAPAAAPAPTTTTTTSPFPPACVWSNFAARVSTDQGSYPAGQPVQITLAFANSGPACTVNASGYACPRVNIDDGAGTLVWSNAAPTTTGCPSAFTGPNVLPGNWSQSSVITWGQDSCTPGQAACPGPQVAAGQYSVVGQDAGGSSQIPAAAPVGITLTS